MNILEENLLVLSIRHAGDKLKIINLNATVSELVNLTNISFPRIEINRQFTIFNQIILIQFMRVNTLVEILKSTILGQIPTSQFDKYERIIRNI
jgi:hypothetical protein